MLRRQPYDGRGNGRGLRGVRSNGHAPGRVSTLQHRGLAPGDDYGALNQALARRYGRIASGQGVAPDAIFIDGGKGQVGAARDALAEVGLSDIALVGIAKGAERKPGLEELWIGERALRLAPDNPGCI